MANQAYFTPKSVLTTQNSSHIFKIAIFSKFFGDLISNIIKEYADEEIKCFLYFSPLNIVIDSLLSVFWYPVFS